MGHPMAERLLNAGFDLALFDIREAAMLSLAKRGALKMASSKELADICEVVIISLPTLKIFRETLQGADGLLAGRKIKTLINICTVGKPFVAEIEALCIENDITLIDAPISGGPAGARDGTLAVMLSGNPVIVAELMPIFNEWGSTIVVAGDVAGTAQTMKLINNILFAACFVATSEGMAMAAKDGIPADGMLEIINNGTGQNFASTTVFPNFVLPGTFDYGATLDVLMKDVELAIEQGEACGVSIRVCQATHLVLKNLIGRDNGLEDVSRVAEMVGAE